ncbi:MAG: Smr/MutS family protein [Rhodobacterales bacterium]
MAAKKLSETDKALWRAVTERIDPMRENFMFEPTVKAKLKAAGAAPQKAKLFDFRIGQKTRVAHYTPSGVSSPKGVTPNMDKKNFQRLVRGKLEIDGRLDLHGLTQEQAKLMLRTKLLQAHGQGKRLILVITGKGKERRDEFNRSIVGVLRQNLPLWLRQAPLASIVLEVTAAQARHGGEGAFYVYLRRNR